MEQWDDQSVDLIYLDPPFNSKSQYNILFGNRSGGVDAQYRAFNDTWAWDEGAADRLARIDNAVAHPAHKAISGFHTMLGKCGMLGYLTYMAERLVHMRRLLKPTGSIYLHCDPTASHYLKVVMDAIFGSLHFRNEIIWSYRRWPSKSSYYQTMHDVILFYVVGSGHTFNVDYEPASDSYLKRFKGKTQVLDPETRTRKITVDKPTKGLARRDVWELSIIAGSSKERLGYPTQKPLALLDRIIAASSNPGDIVLDPFCGCGTAIESAHNLGRKFVGIDISAFAVDLIRNKRLDLGIPVKGIPADLYSAKLLAKDSPFNFESWAVTRLPGFAPNTKQVGDGGVDGKGKIAVKPDNFQSRLALAQAKGGKFNLSSLRDFLHVTKRDNAAFGCYISLNDVRSEAAAREVAEFGKFQIGATEYSRMNLWSIENYFDNRYPPMPPMLDPYNGKKIRDKLANHR